MKPIWDADTDMPLTDHELVVARWLGTINRFCLRGLGPNRARIISDVSPPIFKKLNATNQLVDWPSTDGDALYLE